MMGKENLFLLMNKDFGIIGDFIFNYITYLGDGLFLIPFGIYMLIKNRNHFILCITTIIISTIIAHFIKGHINENNPEVIAKLAERNPRPIEVIKDWSLVHTIPNIIVHNAGSFPSGHTTQVFALFFLCCIVFNNSLVLWIGFILSILTGYSRVYQAQHFPLDIGGGILVAWISVVICYLLVEVIKSKITNNRKRLL